VGFRYLRRNVDTSLHFTNATKADRLTASTFKVDKINKNFREMLHDSIVTKSKSKNGLHFHWKMQMLLFST